MVDFFRSLLSHSISGYDLTEEEPLPAFGPAGLLAVTPAPSPPSQSRRGAASYLANWMER